MKKLLQIEYLKVKNYRTFWLILLIYAALVPLSFMGMSQIDFPFFPNKSELFSFPTIWNYITWVASWWNLLLGVLIVILVCNDINYKTQRQGIIDGLSRRDVILGKLYFLIVLAMAVALYTFVVGAIIGCIYSNPSSILKDIEYVAIYFVQTIGYFSFAFFFAVLVRKPALSIILFIAILMIDVILYIPWIMGDYAQFFPTITIAELTPFPFFGQLMELEASQDPNFEEPFVLSQGARSILAIVYISFFIFIGYFSLKKRDL